MSTPTRFANGYRRRALIARHRAQVKAGAPCGICGRPIDLTRRYPDPWSMVVDEIVPVCHGGDPLSWRNTEPAHRWCNSIKGAKSLQWAREEVSRQLAGIGTGTQQRRQRPSRAPFERLDI